MPLPSMVGGAPDSRDCSAATAAVLAASARSLPRSRTSSLSAGCTVTSTAAALAAPTTSSSKHTAAVFIDGILASPVYRVSVRIVLPVPGAV